MSDRSGVLAAGVAIALAAVSLWPSSAQAQLNYRDVPIGGKSAAMGGVATAAGNDSAMPYINPAGMAGIPGDVFALSAQVYSYSRRRVGDFFAPNGYGEGVEPVSETFTSSNVLSFPSSVTYMKHFGGEGDEPRVTTAFSLIVPAAASFTMTGSSRADIPGQNGGSTANKDVSVNATDYYIGPSWAIELGPRLRLGASLFGLYQTSRRTLSRASFQYVFDGARTVESSLGIVDEYKGTAIVGVAGAQLLLLDGLRLGLGVALPSIRVQGTETLLVQSNDKDSQSTTKQAGSLTGQGYGNRPLRVNAGVWYEQPGSFGLGADVHVYMSRDKVAGYSGTLQNTASRTDDVARSFNTHDDLFSDGKRVIDVSVGGEVWLANSLALRGGFFTNRSPVDLGADPLGIKVDRLGGSAGIGLLLGSFETTLGVVFQHGSGQLNVYDETSRAAVSSGARLVPVGFTEDSAMFLLSAVVTSEEAQKMIKDKLDQVGPKLPGGVSPGVPDAQPSGEGAP